MNQDESNKFRIIVCLLILATLIVLACKRPEPKTKDNALERYINEPKEKAEAVKKLNAVQLRTKLAKTVRLAQKAARKKAAK